MRKRRGRGRVEEREEGRERERETDERGRRDGGLGAANKNYVCAACKSKEEYEKGLNSEIGWTLCLFHYKQERNRRC